MKTLSREDIPRMTNSTGIGGIGRNGGGSGGSGSGGNADYAAEAGHAQTADEATHAQSAVDVDSDSPAYNRWLRKDRADTAAGKITFSAGLESNAASTFNEVVTFVKQLTANVKAWFKQGIKIGSSSESTLGIDGSGNATLNDVDAAGNVSATGNVAAGVNLTVGNNATITGQAQAATMIANLFKTPDFSQIVGMIGLGFGVTTNQNGKATLQTDDLYVLGKMFVNSLNIREVTYIGGTYLLTPAGSTVAKVQKLYSSGTLSDTRTWSLGGTIHVGYRVLWKADDGTTGTMNYWQQGDQAFCQTFNITEPGDYENVENRRYYRLVCRVGQVTISGTQWHYADLANIASVNLYDSDGNIIYNVDGGTSFVGYEDNQGSEPGVDDKIVCLGSQAQTNRQGAIQLTAEGTASMGIYDGIKDFRPLTNYEIHFMSKEQVRMTATKFYWKSGSTTQSQSDYASGVSQQITNTNDRVSTAETNISTLTTTVNGHTTNISSLQQTSDAIKMQVNTFDNLLYNREFLPPAGNSNAQYTPDGWGVSGSYVYADTNLGIANNCRIVRFSQAGTSYNIHCLRQKIWDTDLNYHRLTAGKSHTLSFYAKGSGTLRIALGGMNEYLNSTVYIDGQSSTWVTSGTGKYCLVTISNASAFVRHTIQFTVGNINSLTAEADIYFNSYSGALQLNAPSLAAGRATGIDIKNGIVDIMADNFNVVNSDGEQTMGLNEDGDFEVSGTIKAKNFFHNICVWSPYTNYTTDSWYCDDAESQYAFEVDKYYTKQQIYDISGGAYAQPPTDGQAYDNFVHCSGASDIIYMTAVSWSSVKADNGIVILPRPEDYEGKVVDVMMRSYGTGTYQARIGCINDHMIEGVLSVGSDGSINISQQQTTQTLDIDSGTTKRLMAIRLTNLNACYWFELNANY